MAVLEGIRIEKWEPGTAPDAAVELDLDMLAAVLRDCVLAGASVSFVLPFPIEKARAFWSEQVLPAVQAGRRCVLIARAADLIVGTVQLDFDTPPNQPHRAEVKKLLVHPEARRRGIARVLMAAAEEEARAAHRNLLTLDTAVNSAADPLYRSLGYAETGVIPGYAYNFDGSMLEGTTVMWKRLER